MAKAQYKTKQMAELISYLKKEEGRHVTVSEISDYFTEKGISVGTTTIYRNLEKMVEEGIVAKYTVDGTSSKCEKCGKLIHLQCDEVENLRKHMMEHHSFEMNPVRTVFYGICSDCRK